MLAIGDKAPEFELISAENEIVKLSDYLGQRVVLFFYPKADTPGCTTQACGLRDNYAELQAHNATVIGMSPDQPEALAKWKAKQNFPFALLSDPEHATADAYSVWGEKSMYGNKYMGIIRSHFVIDAEGNLEDVQYKVGPKKSIATAVKHVTKG